MMGRGLSPLQRDILKVLREEPRNKRNPLGSLSTGELSRYAYHQSLEATSRSLRRLCARNLVVRSSRGRYRLSPDLTVTGDQIFGKCFNPECSI